MTEGEGGESVSRRGFLRATAGGAAVAATSGAAAAQEDGNTTTSGGNETTGNGTASGNETSGSGGSGGGGGTATVEVGPGGNPVFTPGTEEPLVIAPGTTVTFKWKSSNHNINVDSQPDGSNWQGVSETQNKGYTHEHTFDTLGEYHYWCDPHKQMGMVADITVQEGGAQETASGPVEPAVSNSSKMMTIVTMAAMVSTLGMAYFFIKYGGDYDLEE